MEKIQAADIRDMLRTLGPNVKITQIIGGDGVANSFEVEVPTHLRLGEAIRRKNIQSTVRKVMKSGGSIVIGHWES